LRCAARPQEAARLAGPVVEGKRARKVLQGYNEAEAWKEANRRGTSGSDSDGAGGRKRRRKGAAPGAGSGGGGGGGAGDTDWDGAREGGAEDDDDDEDLEGEFREGGPRKKVRAPAGSRAARGASRRPRNRTRLERAPP
jgi:hypothetical protein